MSRYLILTQNPALAASLRLWLTTRPFAEDGHVETRTVGKAPDARQLGVEFHRLADWIDDKLDTCRNYLGLPELVVLTDFAGYGEIYAGQLDPLAPQGGWKAVLGMLVLAFPEVHWILAAGSFPKACEAWPALHDGTTPDKLEKLLQLGGLGFSPLFDASGIRHAIRREARIRGESEGVWFPDRPKWAAAIDEEHSYAYLHAYTAYRFGFRAHVVPSYGAMERFLKPDGVVTPGKPELLIEDLFLQFADHHPEHFSDLRRRDKEFPILGDALHRIFVTSGHNHGHNAEMRQSNDDYREFLRDRGLWNCELNKPLAGIFSLWHQSKLTTKLDDGGRPGLASGYEWPFAARGAASEVKGGHSAPGRLLAVADRLVNRAERMIDKMDEVASVAHAVRGAVLATDALEILGGKTPTTSLEALALKHQFEALAECQFVGMEEHLDVENRMRDVRNEVRWLARWFGRSEQTKQSAAWNAELTILNRLIEVFHKHNQFDEEQSLHVAARRLHRKLWFQARPLLKPFEVMPWYVEKLLASVWLFLFALVGWIVVLGLLYAYVGGVDGATIGWDRGIADAYGAFLGIQPPSDDRFWTGSNGWNAQFSLIAFTIAAGFLHLGIFISHLYSIVSRK